MPRRNESGAGRKGSRSVGRSDSARDKSTGKSFKKSDRNDSSSTGKRSFGHKRNFSSQAPSRREGIAKSEGKPFKRPDDSSSRPVSSKTFHRQGKFSENKRSDKRQGFGKPAPSSSGDHDSKGVSKRSRFASPGKSYGPPATGPRKRIDKKPFSAKSDGPRFSSGSSARSSGSKNEGSRKVRGGSFGKPYKRTYEPKPHREGPGVRKRSGVADPTAPKSDKIRLNKFIANSGISSRREADELITMGLISVNGNVISELGYKVNPGDEVRYENKVLRAEKPVYILMNKPKGFLTTTDDPQERKTVMQIIGTAVKERIYPVGRLDRNTTGLLLLTNDGELADKLMHPSFNVKKIYKVELDKPLAKSDFQAIIDGVRLEEGRAEVDDLAIVSDDGRTVGIELHIGWNRVVRRIFESLGYEVIKLDRSVYAGLDKKELGRGQWRFLTKEEIIHLKHFK
jgi:23S rRNA pseudouridine2605 synthase